MSEWWILPDGQPRAVVQIIHGMCEHIGRYRMFAEALSGEGYAVYSCDLPGHGSDCPTLGYAPGSMWENTLSQLREACASVRARYPGLPIAVFGHSYGSFLYNGFSRSWGQTPTFSPAAAASPTVKSCVFCWKKRRLSRRRSLPTSWRS